jgi:hypothetical protein
MNTEIFEQRWIEVKGVIQFLWGHISDHELDMTRGQFDAIAALIIEKYREDPDIVRTRLEPILYKLSDLTEEKDEYFKLKVDEFNDYDPLPQQNNDPANRDISAI